MDAAGLQRDVHRQVINRCDVPRFEIREGIDLAVPGSRLDVPPFADDIPPVRDHTSHGGIGVRRQCAAPRQRQRALKEDRCVYESTSQMSQNSPSFLQRWA